MKKQLLIFIVSIISSTSFSQKSDNIKYYKNIDQSREVKEQKAIFTENTEYLDGGIKKVTFKNINTGNTIWIKEYKDDKPFGFWCYFDSNGNLISKQGQGRYKPDGFYHCDIAKLYNKGLLVENNKTIPLLFKDEKIANQYKRYGIPEYISINVIYPQSAMNKGIQGDVLIGFTIDEYGKVGNVRVIEGVNELIDKEAFNVIESLPDFNPIELDEKNIGIYIECPISFILR